MFWLIPAWVFTSDLLYLCLIFPKSRVALEATITVLIFVGGGLQNNIWAFI